MKRFFTLLLKNIGTMIVLGGVALLAVSHFNNTLTNTHLFIAGGLFIVGILVEIFINKKVM